MFFSLKNGWLAGGGPHRAPAVKRGLSDEGGATTGPATLPCTYEAFYVLHRYYKFLSTRNFA